MNENVMTSSVALLRQGIDAVVELSPKQDRELPVLEYFPMKMTWQLVSRCEGIHLLLTDGLLDEASILLRSLMWDSQRLIYLDHYSDDRAALILGLHQKQLDNWEDMLKIAENRGRDAEPARKSIQEQRSKIENARIKHGVGKLKKFPSEGIGIAKAVGRHSDMIGHKMFSIGAHNAAQSMLTGEDRRQNGSVGLYSRNRQPVYLSAIAGNACEYLFEGTIATAKAQDWGSLDELQSQYSEIEKQFEKSHEDARAFMHNR